MAVALDPRVRLAVPPGRLDDINDLLLDPGARVVNDLLDVVARYGTPDEINRRAREAGTLPALLDRVRVTHPQYLPDLEWLAARRDEGAFVSWRTTGVVSSAPARTKPCSATTSRSRSRSARSSTSRGSWQPPAGRSTSAP